MEGLRAGARLAAYRIESLIGRGGMSVVYLAQDTRLGRRVALKVLATDLAEDPSFRERFVRESRLAASLDHPHIVPIYEADEKEGRLFIAMRYVGATDLEALIRGEGPLSPSRAALIVGQVGSALDAAHVAGLVHRDVKPANILIAPGMGPGAKDHAYLSDFGITKRLSYATASASGEVMGTVDYVSPEVIEGRPVDGRADVYSLGCVLYQSLTGKVPFPKDNEVAILWAHLREKPPSVTSARPDAPADFDRIVARAMAKAPGDRYQRCGDLAAEAEEASRVAAPPVDRDAARRRRRRWVAAVVAAIVVAAAGASLFLALGGAPAVPPIVRTIQGPPGSVGIAAERRNVWIIGNGEILRVDPSTHATSLLGQPGFILSDIEAAADGSVYVGGTYVDGSTGVGGTGPKGFVERIDPASVQSTWMRQLATPVTRVAFGLSHVWALAKGTGELREIDARTGRVVNNFPIQGATDVAVGANAVWLVSPAPGLKATVTRLDPATGTTQGRSVPLPLRAVAAEGDTVWGVAPVAKVNEAEPIYPPRSGSDIPVKVGNDPNALVIEGGFVFVKNAQSLCRIPLSQPTCESISSTRPIVALAAEQAPTGKPTIWILVAGRSSAS